MNVSTVNSSSAMQGAQGMRRPPKLSDETVSALADKLRVSADELKTKLESSDDPRKVLDQLAQEKGVSTDELREVVRATAPQRAGQTGEAGPPPPPPGGAGGPGGVSFDDEAGQKLLETLADKMGTSSDELKSRLDSGESLKDILDASGLSHEDVKSAFEEAFKSVKPYNASGSTADSAALSYSTVDVSV
ncbi:MAG: hypothetical protein IT306_24685 [Chloroflexi bacterium]|nr:hypothetical protein [Chloroflexota bacterium]